MPGPQKSLGVIRGLDAITPDFTGAVLTIGNFDGVHIGHQSILHRCRQRADELQTRVVAMTFEPHPVAILRPDRAPPILTPLAEKCGLLLSRGADGVIVVPVDQHFLNITAENFVRNTLIARLAPKAIVEGPNFHFGHDRKGDAETLRSFAAEGGYDIEVVEADDFRLRDGSWKPISSSIIRELLRAGDVESAARCLSRPYMLTGFVEKGAGMGHQIGFPTINLGQINQLIPADGVYAGVAMLGRSGFKAAISIGSRETFDGTIRVIEAFLLDADGSFYDQRASLGFIERLRDQKRFDSPEELSKQIAQDVAQTRAQNVHFAVGGSS